MAFRVLLLVLLGVCVVSAEDVCSVYNFSLETREIRVSGYNSSNGSAVSIAFLPVGACLYAPRDSSVVVQENGLPTLTMTANRPLLYILSVSSGILEGTWTASPLASIEAASWCIFGLLLACCFPLAWLIR